MESVVYTREDYSHDWQYLLAKWGRVLGYTLFGATIFLLFALTLVTAMTQHQIARNLASSEDPVSYTDAYLLFGTVPTLEESQQEIITSIADNEREIAETENLLQEQNAILTEDRRKLLTSGRSSSIATACPEQFNEATDSAALDNSQIIDRLELCQASSPENFREIVSDSAIFGKLRSLERQAKASAVSLESLSTTLESRQAELNDVEQRIAMVESFRSDFYPQDRLKTIMPGWLHWIFDIPPTIMPIFLTFVSGIFGSLLVNLILIVYPNNKVGLYSGQHFLQHVILGGLIATAVYIVIGAGASVLSLSGGSGAQDAFLTFSAIGIFAGMFSDRAARWLSENVPFNEKTPPDGPAESPAPA